MIKKTKIICTIGPSSKSAKVLEKLITGGMDIARINTSHSPKEEILEITAAIRDISARHNKITAILLDLQGPKIRVGRLDKDIEIVNIDYGNFLNDIKEGNTVFLDDGLLECTILKIFKDKRYAEAKVIIGGILKS